MYGPCRIYWNFPYVFCLHWLNEYTAFRVWRLFALLMLINGTLRRQQNVIDN